MRVRISLCVRLAKCARKQIEIAHGIWKLSHTHTHTEVCAYTYVHNCYSNENEYIGQVGRQEKNKKKKEKNYELHFECILM